MTNRTLLSLTAIVLIGMGILLALNLTSILTGAPPNQLYLRYNDVRGMALVYQQKSYTLNFKQQNDVIDMINRSVQVIGLKPGKQQKPDFEKIIVYQFKNLPDIEITPVAYVEKSLVFSAPSWNQGGYLMDVTYGKLQELLSETHD